MNAVGEMEENTMQEESLTRIGTLRVKLERTERARRDAKKGIDRTMRRGLFADTVGDFFAALMSVALQEIYLRALTRRRDALQTRLDATRRRAMREHHAAAVRAYEDERDRERRMREAVLELRVKYGDRPARICGREPQTDEELRLVEDFLAGAEERHLYCVAAWRRSGYDDVVQERVRGDLERDLPLRRYERREASRKASTGAG